MKVSSKLESKAPILSWKIQNELIKIRKKLLGITFWKELKMRMDKNFQ
jgi:hypothetical protein